LAAVTTLAVPSDIAGPVSRAWGVDVSGVPMHRGPAVTARARTLAARAFSHDGQVFLPDEAGEVGDAEARALLAHELTHVVQQRLFGADMPAEATPDGQLLEAQAAEVEGVFRRGGGELAHLRLGPIGRDGVIPTSPVSTSWAATRAGAGVVQRVEGSFTQTLASAGPVGFDGTALDPATIAEIAAALEAARPEEFSEPAESPQIGDLYDVPFSEPTMPSAADLTVRVADRMTSPSGVSVVDPQLRETVEELVASHGRRLVDLDDSGVLDELAGMLYQRLRQRLRHELLIDRERSGSLMDFR
jgi:hypothetical protein